MVRSIKGIIDQYETRLIHEYQSALDAIRRELIKIQDAYKAGNLTDADRFRYSRNLAIMRDINRELERHGVDAVKIQKSLQQTAFKKGYYRSMYRIDQQTGFWFSYDNPTFSIVPTDAVAAVNDNARFLEAARKLEFYEKETIRTKIMQGLIQGQSIPVIAAEIKDTIGMTANRARVIARTETMRASNAGALQASRTAQSFGVELVKQWVATLDDRTRDSHQAMDGKPADVEGEDGEMYFEFLDGENAGSLTLAPGQSGIAGEDISCRCTFINVVAGYEPKNRAARDDGGKSTVIDYQDYDSWAADKGIE